MWLNCHFLHVKGCDSAALPKLSRKFSDGSVTISKKKFDGDLTS